MGYKWYDAEKKTVLFPFGFGLSYTTYAYSGLTVKSGDGLTVSFTVKNTGARAGRRLPRSTRRCRMRPASRPSG